MSKPPITKICLKITCLKFHSNFVGTNEFTHRFHKTSVGNRGHVTVRSSTLHPDQAANYWHFHLACRTRLVVALNFREGQDLYPGMTQTRAGGLLPWVTHNMTPRECLIVWGGCPWAFKALIFTWIYYGLKSPSALVALYVGNQAVTSGLPLWSVSNAVIWCFLLTRAIY